MTRVVYVNGRYLPYAKATVHVEDRGFQFADAVYEVIEVRSGALIEASRHLGRLVRSLGELGMPMPMTEAALRIILHQTVRRNRVRDGMAYLQVTRGVAPRDFDMPAASTPAGIVCLARDIPKAFREKQAELGIAVVTVPDIRWGRCDIKTTMLLPAVLAKQNARARGAKEAWLVDAEGFVTEAASANAWIVSQDGLLVTRALSATILPGVTRAALIDLVAAEGLVLQERAFTPAEAAAAKEAFVTSATSTVMPVVKIDGAMIGDGSPGPIAQRLRKIFHSAAATSGGSETQRGKPLS